MSKLIRLIPALVMSISVVVMNVADATTSSAVNVTSPAPIGAHVGDTSRVAPYLIPTCATVTASAVGSAFGESMSEAAPSYPHGPLSFGNTPILVGGKSLDVTWIACTYQHKLGVVTGLGVSISYLVEYSSSQALAIVKAMCAQLRTFASNYTTPADGDYACAQGHSGSMASSNAVIAVRNVVVNIFGSQGPVQNLALVHSVAVLVARAPTSTTTTTPGQPNSVSPKVTLSASTFAMGHNFIAVRLRCAGQNCMVSVSFSRRLSMKVVILAASKFMLPKSSVRTVDVRLSSAGSRFLKSATTSLVAAKLTVVVMGGATINKTVKIRRKP